MKRIKPCPFCGAQPNGPYKWYRFVGSSERDGYNFTVRIECGCGVRVEKPSSQDKSGWCNDTGQAERAVIAAWNNRATLKERKEQADA